MKSLLSGIFISVFSVFSFFISVFTTVFTTVFISFFSSAFRCVFIAFIALILLSWFSLFAYVGAAGAAGDGFGNVEGVGGSYSSYEAGEVPSWVYYSAQQDGDAWLFSGSVHDISLLNVAIPLARSAALANLASSIGVNIDGLVGQKIEGSEIDGYTEAIIVSHGYVLDRVAAYGVRQREVFVEPYNDPYAGRTKYNVYVLLEVADADLRKARSDFARRAYVGAKKSVMKSKEAKAGVISGFIRKIGF